MMLKPRQDPDVASSQLMKDIRRETVEVNGELFEGATRYEALFSALENIVLAHSPGLSGNPLELKVERILRGCSRTVSGFDAYEIVAALMQEVKGPKALVTPAMMNNSPIRIELCDNDTRLTLSSVNVFKVSRELPDGSLATVVVFRTEVTEQIELDTWTTVRWMSLKPLDKAEECLNPVLLFRDRTLASLLEHTSKTDERFNKILFDFTTRMRESLDLAIEQTIRSVKQLAEAEYHRGAQDAALERNSYAQGAASDADAQAPQTPRSSSPRPSSLLGQLISGATSRLDRE